MLAIAVSALLILWAPFVGEVRRRLLSSFPGRFPAIVGGIVAVALAAALVHAVVRIRDRRRARYLMLAAALVLAATYAVLTRTGNPIVDAVERFHFVEYGLVTWLFYRAWRPLDDGSVFVLPVLAGLIVGTADEWFQWFIPARIGELRDVFLNGAALACGLLFSLALDPPDSATVRFRKGSLSRIGGTAAAVLIAVAAFIHVVHLGYEVSDPDVSFRSRYTRGELQALSADRAIRWRGRTLPIPPRLSSEDQYFSEAVWHVQRRNQRWAEGDIRAAAGENRILERFYAPVLDTPSYLAPSHRWPPEQRADAEARAAGDLRPYASDAHVYPIYTWSKAVMWILVGAAALMLTALTIWIERNRR